MQPRSISFSITLTVLLVLMGLIGEGTNCHAMGNPAVKYCLMLGYQYIGTTDSSGNEKGHCLLPDNSRVEVWEFFQGKVGQNYSYCAQKGFRTETRTQTHSSGFITQRAVCIGPDSLRAKAEIELDMLDLLQSQGYGLIQSSPLRIPSTAAFRRAEKFSEIPTRVLPQKFDWRDQNALSYIGPVRDQGACGDCYAFGAAAAAEAAYNIYHKKFNENTVDLSESYIAWCLGAYGPYSEHFSGCKGADYEYAELEALTREGVTQERYFPYIETDPGSCNHQNNPVHIFSDWGRIPPGDIAGIKNAIMEYGVLDAAILAPPEHIFYTGGIYSDEQTDCPDGAYTETNHAVALVGWGYDAVQGDYWILRNSWGAGWGENGYMKIIVNAARVGCSATYLQYNRDGTPPPIIPAWYLLKRNRDSLDRPPPTNSE